MIDSGPGRCEPVPGRGDEVVQGLTIASGRAAEMVPAEMNNLDFMLTWKMPTYHIKSFLTIQPLVCRCEDPVSQVSQSKIVQNKF